MEIKFDFEKLNPNFFLHAWHFNNYSNNYAETWLNIVTEETNEKFRVYDLVDLKIYKPCSEDFLKKEYEESKHNEDYYHPNYEQIKNIYENPKCTFISYGDGDTFEDAKNNAAIYFFNHHKDFNYIDSLNLLKNIIPEHIDLTNSYETIMSLAEKKFMVKPTYSFGSDGKSCSMHIHSMGKSMVNVEGDNKKQVRNLAAYIYICKFFIINGEDFIDDSMMYNISLEFDSCGFKVKYPYNEGGARISGYFKSVEGHRLIKFYDERKNKEPKPKIQTILTKEALKSNRELEDIIYESCLCYEDKINLIEEKIKKQKEEKLQKYYEPLDPITEKGLTDDYGPFSLDAYLDYDLIEEECENRNMTIEELQKDYDNYANKEKAKMRKKIIESGDNPYLTK